MTTQYTDLQLDALCELANIASGNACAIKYRLAWNSSTWFSDV